MLQSLFNARVRRAGQPWVALFGALLPWELPLPNPGFDVGLSGWTVTAPAGAAAHSPAPGASAGSARLRVAEGASARLEAGMEVGAAGDPIDWTPQLGEPGERPRFGARLMRSSSTNSGSFILEVRAVSSVGERVLARGEASLRALSPGRWVWVDAAPLDGGRLRAGDESLRFSLTAQSVAGGATELFVDECRAALHEDALMPLQDGDFETPLVTGGPWDTWGVTLWSDPLAAADDYTGQRHAVLEGRSAAGLRQELALYQEPFQLASGQRAEAGLWVRAGADAALGERPVRGQHVEVKLLAGAGGRWQELGVARWSPAASDRGAWRYVEVSAKRPLQLTHELLRLEVEKTFSGSLSVDSASLGARGAVHGHPPRLVGCNYVGRYASVAWEEAGPGTPGLQWRNWRWTTGTPCDPGWEGLNHDPDCDVSLDCRRSNGRRDAAVSELSGASKLPLAGTYDSRDPAIVRYHVRSAMAVGVDHFIFDHLGHTLAEQTRASGMQALNEDSFEVLLDEVDAMDGGFRVAIMYEPKIHFQGWITSEETLAERRAGVTRDLIHYASTYGRRRGVLRHDGRLVVYVFRNSLEWGGEGMSPAAWRSALEKVERSTGERLFLIADNQPGEDSVFGGLSRWSLVSRDYLRFRTFGDLRHMTPSWPEPSVGLLEAHARGVASSVRAWAWSEGEGRVAATVVWPGFDDSGVAGWGGMNLTGEDGLPLCVRVADELEGAFFATTQAAALDCRPDWIQIATWNDWNELTQIEPAWHPQLEEELRAGALSPEVLQHCFGRALEAQAMAAEFLGLELSEGELLDAAHAYLLEVAEDPATPSYD